MVSFEVTIFGGGGLLRAEEGQGIALVAHVSCIPEESGQEVSPRKSGTRGGPNPRDEAEAVRSLTGEGGDQRNGAAEGGVVALLIGQGAAREGERGASESEDAALA